MAQLVDLIVHRGILFDIRVRTGDICLRLVIIVIGHKILHSVMREKFLQLIIKLRRKRFVVCNHKRWLLQPLNDVRHGKGFAGTRHT